MHAAIPLKSSQDNFANPNLAFACVVKKCRGSVVGSMCAALRLMGLLLRLWHFLQRLSCSGYLDSRRRVGFVTRGACKIVPWRLILLTLVPVDVSDGKLSEDLPGVVILWPNVASLYYEDAQAQRSKRNFLGQ